MGELPPEDNNPFNRLQPADFEPPVWDALPSEVLRQLTAEGGPGIVTQPVTQREYASTAELIPDYEEGVPGHSGIMYYFNSNPGISTFIKQLPVAQRFRIMHPELHAYLINKLSTVRDNAPHELHESLFMAYRIMRHLVDAKDPYITREDGSVDHDFLNR